MRTTAYIDGFNFYFGAVKDTPYKWLDFRALLRNILQPHYDITSIKYFTARVSSLPQNPNADKRQQVYLKAIKAFIPGLEIIYGHFTVHIQNMPYAVNPHQRVPIIKVEEKGSDVNLAATLVNDSWKNLFDCAVIISNDGDLAEALRIVSEEKQKKIILLTPPRFKQKRSKALKKYASDSLTIKIAHLAKSQLPNPIPGTDIRKPDSWNYP